MLPASHTCCYRYILNCLCLDYWCGEPKDDPVVLETQKTFVMISLMPLNVFGCTFTLYPPERAYTVLLGIEESVEPTLSAKVVNMFLVITSHQTNYP